MHIVVTVKQVHDPNIPQSFMTIGPDGRSLQLHSAASLVLNAYDANAIEEAVRIKERVGGTITVLTLGDASSVGHLRRAIAMGADKAVHVEGPVGIAADAETIAQLLAAAIQKLDPADIILCGRQASDTDAGQVPFLLAERLGALAASPVVAVGSVDGGSVVFDRLSDGAVQRIEASLPVVLAVSNEINKPRVPGLKGVMTSKKAAVPTWTLADLGIAPPRPALIPQELAIAVRPVMSAKIVTAANDEMAGRALAELLNEEGFL